MLCFMICGLSFLFWFFQRILILIVIFSLFQWQKTGAEYCLCKGFRHDLRWLEQEVGTIRYLTRAVQSSYLSPFHKQYLQSCGKKTPGPWGENIILEFIGRATKCLLETFVVLYYVLSYFVCFLSTLHTVSYFRFQFPARRILMPCAVFDTLNKIELFCGFFEKRVMFLKRFSSSFINRFFKAGVKIQVDLTGCSLHIESFS